MRALSIRQPWAWLVVNGYKDIENRTWSTGFRGRVYVHAGQRMVPDDYPEQREFIADSGIVLPSVLARGAILGEVTITGCVSASRRFSARATTWATRTAFRSCAPRLRFGRCLSRG